MCFSAEASFTAAAVLTVVSLGLIMMRKPKNLRLLALTPLLFALQQASEGGLALLLPTAAHSELAIFFQYFFLFFAFLIWPVWLPFSIFVAERVPMRKKILAVPLIAGVAFVIFVLTYLPENRMTVEIVGHSIQYGMQRSFEFNDWIVKGAYGFIVLAPNFISSLKGIKGFGVLVILSWIFTAIFFAATFTSTWCFFSAILSIYLGFVIKENR